jgi:hypothetical protein
MNTEYDLEQLDQLAREFWQDDLAKFFLKQKEPTYTEYRMFQAGYQKAVETFLSEYSEEHSTLKLALKETKEQLKDTLAFIEAMEEQTK